MSITLQSHAFAGNPLRSKLGNPFSPTQAIEALKAQLLLETNAQSPSSSSFPVFNFKVLPFRKGRPLASSNAETGASQPNWQLGWISLDRCKALLENSGVQLTGDSMVYLGFRVEDGVIYWAIDVSSEGSLVPELGSQQSCFVELRTLMVATDWADDRAMAELAIAGHVSYLMGIAYWLAFSLLFVIKLLVTFYKKESNQLFILLAC